MYQSLRVQHASSDGLLMHLANNNGFGRLTKASAGGDDLAQQMIRSFATRDAVPVGVGKLSDAAGYVKLTINLLDYCTDAWALPPALREFICTQHRKTIMCEVGSIQSARVAKTSAQGAVVTLPNAVTGVCTGGKLRDGVAAGDTVEVRVLDYNAAASVAQVSVDDALCGSPVTTDMFPQLAELRMGQCIACRVVFPAAATAPYIVVSVDVPGTAGTLIGYVQRAAGAAATALGVGATLDATVLYTPHQSMYNLTPFVVLSQGRVVTPLHPPALRCVESDSTAALKVPFSWRRPDTGDAGADKAERDEDQPRMRRRKLEEAIDAVERAQHKAPTSAEEFQKLLLGSPNSSFLWTQYMSFYVATQQYEQARVVAEKALKTINIREARELLNVFVAYMNLENMHGTAESLTAIFRRCLERSEDPCLVHEKLADIFQASKKNQQLLALYRTMTSKFRHERKTWERYAVALAEQDKRDQLKRVLREMASALDKSNQCLVVEHVAIHEYRNGHVEHGRALFEGLVLRFPKKTDVWSVYIDQETALLQRGDKAANVDTIRSIFDRVSSLNLAPKVMQQFLARFLAFEQANGDAASVEGVKERARKFVESKISQTV